MLVEEKNHRDGAQPSEERRLESSLGPGRRSPAGRAGRPHTPVVPDALEEVQSLLQAVGLVVLPNDHVVAAAGHHEDDGSHVIEALDPLAAFIALATHVEHAGRGRTLGYPGPTTLQDRVRTRQPSTYWKLTLSTWNLVSKIPEVRTRQRSRS